MIKNVSHFGCFGIRSLVADTDCNLAAGIDCNPDYYSLAEVDIVRNPAVEGIVHNLVVEGTDRNLVEEDIDHNLADSRDYIVGFLVPCRIETVKFV